MKILRTNFTVVISKIASSHSEIPEEMKECTMIIGKLLKKK